MGSASPNRRDGPNVCIGGEVISLNINYQLLLVSVCLCVCARVYGPHFSVYCQKNWKMSQDSGLNECVGLGEQMNVTFRNGQAGLETFLPCVEWGRAFQLHGIFSRDKDFPDKRSQTHFQSERGRWQPGIVYFLAHAT